MLSAVVRRLAHRRLLSSLVFPSIFITGMTSFFPGCPGPADSRLEHQIVPAAVHVPLGVLAVHGAHGAGQFRMGPRVEPAP